MKLRLRSIDKAPTALPIWQSIRDDLGNPPLHRIARRGQSLVDADAVDGVVPPVWPGLYAASKARLARM